MMDKNIYKSYKQRLISIDSRNSSFFLTKLMPKRHIDLVKVNQDLKNDMNMFQILSENKEIHIKKEKIDFDALNEILVRNDSDLEDDVKDLIPLIKNVDIDKILVFVNKDDFNNKKDNFIKELIQKYEEEKYRILKQFENLNNQNRKIEREFGKNDLFLGFPFLEGKFQNGKDFRGPLILHRIQISSTAEGVVIQFSEDNKIINPVFLLSYINENNKKYQRFDFEIPEDTSDYIRYTTDFLKNNGINIVLNNSKTMSKIESISKKDYTNKYLNQVDVFKIMNYAVVGIFPLSNRSIYNDLDFLDKNPSKTSNVLNDFLMGSKPYDDESDVEAPKEELIKYISPIDWSQRVVIKEAIKDNLVIEGPPGTGKSQTIVNIIINLLIQNKRVLVVSEKLAAIEVVYNRLGMLKENTLIIKDYIRNKEDFFSQVKESAQRSEYDKRYSYNSEYDNDITFYLEANNKICEKNYYGDYNFSQVLDIIRDKKDYNISDDNKELIGNFLDYIKKNKYDLNTRIDELIEDHFVEEYKKYLEQKKKISVDNVPINETMFLITQNMLGYTKEQIQFNYFLNKTNEQSNTYEKTLKIEKKIQPRFFNYSAFKQYSTELFERIKTYEKELKEFFTPLYSELHKDLKLIKIAIKWSQSTDFERQIDVKSLSNPKFKINFFDKLFKKPITLNEKEVYLFDYFSNYAENFNLNVLKILSDKFLELDYILIEEFITREYENYNHLISLMLNNNFIVFKDLHFDKVYEQIFKISESIDMNNLIFMSKYTDVELRFVDFYLNTKLEKIDFINLILYLSIDENIVKKTIEISEYVSNNNENYRVALDSLGKKYDESARFVYNHVKENIQHQFKYNAMLYGEYANLVEQSNLKRRKSVKTIFERYGNSLSALYPVMLMTPDVVSTVFKMEENQFDYVIFDEASQMFIERAVPTIFRAKKVVVAGDSKQLKPSSTFTTRIAEDDEIDDDDSISRQELEALDKESLLEMAKSKYKSKMIQFHYRSDHEELIQFSSASFYENKLFFASDIKKGKFKKPIEVINTDGIWTEGNLNPIEAEKVVDLVEMLLNRRKNNETIGVITFNIKQKELIQELLEDSTNPAIIKELERVNETTRDDESLFVKNIENVQGDERDIIIFSIGYGFDNNGRLKTQFGLLNQIGGENRLNVAITRAKKKIYIVKSFKANQLKLNSKNEGPVKFKQYLEFSEYVSDGENDKKENLLNSIYDTTNNKNEGLEEFDSPFEQEVYDDLLKIISDDLVIKNQINVGGYKIDFALFDKINNKFILGIECDGYQFHSTPMEKERDFFRQQYLESRGWYIHRILSTNWWIDKEKELNKITEVIEALRKSNV